MRNMKISYNAKILLLAFLTVITLYIIYYSELIPALPKNVPLNVYATYIDAKLTFGCNDCSYVLQKCEDANGTIYYWVDGWYQENWGRDRIFDATGHQLCDVRPTFADCWGGCEERYAGCPKVRSCNTMMGTG
jgi:hypothetical protein